MVAPAALGDHVTPVRRVVPLLVVPVLVLAAVLLVTAVEPLRVSSQSMRPTLEAGDQVLVDKLSVHWRPPAEGELIVFRDPCATSWSSSASWPAADGRWRSRMPCS